eukprot:364308-Chlamydomonas_euryale.AAC.11
MQWQHCRLMRVLVQHEAVVLKQLQVAVPSIAQQHLVTWSIAASRYQPIHPTCLVKVPIAPIVLTL